MSEKNNITKQAEKLLKQSLNDSIERELNAYEEACAKYLDEKVDKERFKKDYHIEIRNLVENDDLQEKFNPISSKYRCILKVYKEWNDMENT